MHAVSEINRLIEHNVFRRNGHAVYNGEVRLGGNTNEAAEWLMKPDQIEFRAEMLQKFKKINDCLRITFRFYGCCG